MKNVIIIIAFVIVWFFILWDSGRSHNSKYRRIFRKRGISEKLDAEIESVVKIHLKTLNPKLTDEEIDKWYKQTLEKRDRKRKK